MHKKLKTKNSADSVNKYYNFTYFAKGINFDAIEKIESKGEEFLFQNLLFLFEQYSTNIAEKNILIKAFELAKSVHSTQYRESGAAFVTHPLTVALLAVPYKPCIDFLAATILHDVIEDYNTADSAINNSLGGSREYISNKIKTEFGETVCSLIEGVSKVAEIKNDISTIDITDKQKLKTELSNKTIEKIFQHSALDFRILLIKIFDRLHNIITIAGKKDPEKRKKKVQEAISIYVASAKRLGLWNLKILLENACARALNYEVSCEKNYAFTYLENLKKIIKNTKIVEEQNSVMNRGQYSSFILIEVESEEECYRVFSKLNKELYLKKNTFSDYISRPKINKYRALHAHYIVNNSKIIEIHIVSSEMKKRNIYGVFLNAKNKDFTLPLLSDETICELSTESEQTIQNIENIKSSILTPQFTIHNSEIGKITVAKGLTALDVGIILYPNRYKKIKKIIINSREENFNTSVKNNDIVECIFSEQQELTRNWLNLVVHKEKISEVLSLLPHIEKQEKGQQILQEIFDEKKIGIANVLCDNSGFLSSLNCNIISIEDLYVAIYEGKIRGYECVYQFEEYNTSDSGNVKTPIEKIQIKKIQFSSSLSLFSQVEDLFSDISKKTSVSLSEVNMNRKNNNIEGSVVVKSLENKITNFIQGVKPEITCKYTLSNKFLLQVFAYLLLPIGISLLIFSILLAGIQLSALWFYFGSIFIVIANVLTYNFLHKYFAIIRDNFSALLAVIGVNIALSFGYIYLFFKHSYDIYNMTYYYPLILLVFSMGLPAFFVSNKKSISSDVSATTVSEFRTKQKEKMMGYLLRFSAIVVWGLDPLLLKYSPLSEIPLDIKMGLLFLGGVLFMLSIILVFKRTVITSLYKIPINGAFKLLIIAKLLFAFLSVISLQYTSGTSFILLNNFAPIFSLLIAFIFWRSSVLYLQDKKNVIKMFIIFLLGSIGTSFIFYKDIVSGGVLSFWGNIFAILTMLADVLFMTVVIRYSPSLRDNQSYFVNFYLYLASFLCFLPFLLFNISEVFQLSLEKILWALGVGALWGLGTLLNYEAFRRMDGFIGFLMFNLAILITISVESFFLQAIEITPFLLLGAGMVIGASILAEMINTKCEKENIKKEVT